MNTARKLEALKGKLSISEIEQKARALAIDEDSFNDGKETVYDFKDGSLVRFLTLESFSVCRIFQVQDCRA